MQFNTAALLQNQFKEKFSPPTNSPHISTATHTLVWPYLNSWAYLSLEVNKRGQRSMKTIIEMFQLFGLNWYQNILMIKVNYPFLYSSMEKNCKDSNDFWHRKMALKIRILQIWPSIPNQAKYLGSFYGCFQFHRPLALFTHH